MSSAQHLISAFPGSLARFVPAAAKTPVYRRLVDQVRPGVALSDHGRARRAGPAYGRVVTVAGSALTRHTTDLFALASGGQSDPAMLRAAVETVSEAITDGESVLVHGQGIRDRGPIVLAAAIAVADDVELEDALEDVRAAQPAIDPSDELLDQAADLVEARR